MTEMSQRKTSGHEYTATSLVERKLICDYRDIQTFMGWARTMN